MNNWGGQNRRKFPRVNYPCLITVRQEKNNPEVILTHTENIAIGGVCVIINRNLPAYSPVELEIDLLDMGNHLRCTGKIVWAFQRKADERRKPSFFEIGIEFQGLDSVDQRRLDEVIRRLIKQSKIPLFPTS